MANEHIAKITIYQLALPFRGSFSHSSASRSIGDNVIVEIELGNGRVGFGETLARKYVTGESPDDVVASIRDIFLPILAKVRPDGFGEVIESLEQLPMVANDKPVYAGRCAVELALIDVYGKYFRRTPAMLSGWIDQPDWEPPGATIATTYSGVIGAVSPSKAVLLARLMRAWKLRDIKIKVGDELEYDRLVRLVNLLDRAIEQHKVRLRVDANGAWKPDKLTQKIDMLEELGILYLEQPTHPKYDELWKSVQHTSGVNLIADESLVSMADAERLTKEYSVGIFNIRLAKNGGLLPALRLAAFAYSKGIEVQLGCMVGETGILTVAGQWFANIVPELIFAEGGYGRLLVKDDLLKRHLRFHYGGKIPTPIGYGLGIEVNRDKLRRYCISEPIVINV